MRDYTFDLYISLYMFRKNKDKYAHVFHQLELKQLISIRSIVDKSLINILFQMGEKKWRTDITKKKLLSASIGPLFLFCIGLPSFKLFTGTGI